MTDIPDLGAISSQWLPPPTGGGGRGSSVRYQDRFFRGGAFIFDRPANTPAVWGQGDQVLWAQGEALMIAGEQGVGKTTVAGQLTRARLGLASTVLGFPVREGEGTVLYLAMDRPQQAGRALLRQFHGDERRILDNCLRIWSGPPPADVADNPDLLRELAAAVDADTVILDSLKDAALGLVTDDVGAAYNRARQLLTQDGVELLELHHVTKKSVGLAIGALGGVYGSVFLTAGGSVILLEGSPGSSLVTLRHLKQPSAIVGPLVLHHDHRTGTTTVHNAGVVPDLVTAAREAPLTAKQAAQLMFDVDEPERSQIEAARRRLDKLEEQGQLVSEGASRGGAGGSRAKTWRPPHKEYTSGPGLRTIHDG